MSLDQDTLLDDLAEAAFFYEQRRCHDEIDPRVAVVRDQFAWAVAVVMGVRRDLHGFAGRLIQYVRPDGTVGQVCPDHFLVVSAEPPTLTGRYDLPLEEVAPLLVVYHRLADESEATVRRCDAELAACEQELAVPYRLTTDPTDKSFVLERLAGGRYQPIEPHPDGPPAIPELGLSFERDDCAGYAGFLRPWFGGERVPLAYELADRLATERTARHTVEAEVARLKAELAARTTP